MVIEGLQDADNVLRNKRIYRRAPNCKHPSDELCDECCDCGRKVDAFRYLTLNAEEKRCLISISEVRGQILMGKSQ